MRSTQAAARGVVFIHSCPRALMSHVEWAVERAVERTQPHEWASQPIQTGMFRCEFQWYGTAGTAAMIASALRGFPNLRFEVTEQTDRDAGERFSFTPSLGMFRAATGPNGDITVGEERLRGLANDLGLRFLFTMAVASDPRITLAIALVLGLLMVSEVPLPSLKFKHGGWKGNETVFLLIGLGTVLALLFGILAVPLLLISYLLSPLWGKLFPQPA